MSIETILERIAKSLETISTSLNYVPTETQPAAPPPAPVPAPVPPAPAPAPTPAPQPAAAPAPQPAAEALPAPFHDSKGLMEYCMAKYRELGPIKGGMIQTALMNMGCSNINALQPAQYSQFYSTVEAIQ